MRYTRWRARHAIDISVAAFPKTPHAVRQRHRLQMAKGETIIVQKASGVEVVFDHEEYSIRLPAAQFDGNFEHLPMGIVRYHILVLNPDNGEHTVLGDQNNKMGKLMTIASVHNIARQIAQINDKCEYFVIEMNENKPIWTFSNVGILEHNYKIVHNITSKDCPHGINSLERNIPNRLCLHYCLCGNRATYLPDIPYYAYATSRGYYYFFQSYDDVVWFTLQYEGNLVEIPINNS